MVIVISWLFTIWTCKVFLTSLYYKFDPTAAEPAHIFSTIGKWMNDILGQTAGDLFANFGQYLIGGAELLVSLILLSPLLLKSKRELLHCVGGVMASGVMAGAIFFHLFTPLGWVPTWVENGVVHTDTNLANAAVSIFILGLVVAFLNRNAIIK